jgi:hypothetical protein
LRPDKNDARNKVLMYIAVLNTGNTNSLVFDPRQQFLQKEFFMSKPAPPEHPNHPQHPSKPDHPDVPPGPPSNRPNPGHGAPKPPEHRPVG